jgi:hypothetical protein
VCEIVHLCVCACVCVYVCVCVRERERERECVCVCVYVIVHMRARVCEADQVVLLERLKNKKGGLWKFRLHFSQEISHLYKKLFCQGLNEFKQVERHE